MQTTREIYLDACAEIGSALGQHGFKYAKSGPHAKRTTGDFSFGIYFQSSIYNSTGAKVALWIHAIVRSKRLSAWRSSRSHPLRTDDWVAGGQIGNLRTPPRWLDLNLADSEARPATISTAIAAIDNLALPFFSAFEDVPSLCDRLVSSDFSGTGMDMSTALEFLLCFSTQSTAEACFHRFLRSRADLLQEYHCHLDRFRRDGLPGVTHDGYAGQLAFATIAYELKPPTPA